jgi:hypothetical protein
MLQSSPAGAAALFTRSGHQCKSDALSSAKHLFGEIEKSPSVETAFALYRAAQ